MPLTVKKAAWMNETVRNLIVATRPWSAPASLAPIALAGALSVRDHEASLWCWEFVCCFLLVLLLHLAANLFNTYYDFTNKVDSLDADSDDRSLIEGIVSPASVLAMGVIFFLSSAAIAYSMVIALGESSDAVYGLLARVVGTALVLAFSYTANPFSLKYYGLGDLTVFIMFGPLLMYGVELTLVASVRSLPFVSFFTSNMFIYSIPIGLLTNAILHANNVRDIDADRAAGAYTIAQTMGARVGRYFYNGLVIGAYVWVLVLAYLRYSHGHADYAKLLLPFCDLPWAIYNIRAFEQSLAAQRKARTTKKPSKTSVTVGEETQPAAINDNITCGRTDASTNSSDDSGRRSDASSVAWMLRHMPQRTAQHNLLFTVLYTMGVCTAEFNARLLLGCLFYLGGINNIIMWSYMVQLCREKIATVLCMSKHSPVMKSLAPLFLASAIIMQLAASVGFILGVHARECAMVLLVFLVPVTFIMHDMWTVETENVQPMQEDNPRLSVQRSIPPFPTEFDNEFVHFFKNVQIIGGLVVYCVYAPQ